LLG
ncbi:hypothetical protein AB1N83_014261, partial [Pleurotus pulmonarius]|jgi:hypothetical protein